MLTVKGVTGALRSGATIYQFEPIGLGLHAIVRVDETKLPPDHPPGSVKRTVARNEAGLPGHLKTALVAQAPIASAALASSLSSNTQIDVLVAYTASAAAAHGDIDGLIQLAVDEANTSYANSGISANLFKVYAAQVSYNESAGTQQQHRDALQATSDGQMDIVHTWRSQYKADVVVLLVNDSDEGTACGVASEILATASTAFALSHYGCAAAPSYTFAHEVGHLQGADHDLAYDCDNIGYECAPFQYNHGYIAPSGQWRTIMAYPYECGHCPVVQYWSNPNVIYPPTGEVMGTATYEDNARVLNETKATIAAFVSSLSASISGPSLVPRNSTCEWVANVSGGTPPYSYEWRVTTFPFEVQSYYSSMWYTNDGRSFRAHLWVTDAANSTVQVSTWVDVAWSAPAC